jgi:prepilin-type processing-associated H-X9-DG protein
MAADNWPPGPNNTTGVGLWWGRGEAKGFLGHDTQNLGELALVKLSWLPDAGDTLLLTEFPNKANRLGRVECIRGGSVREQARELAQPAQFHFGRFNYLMCDGHVEPLTSLQTGGMDSGQAGIWSIKKEIESC